MHETLITEVFSADSEFFKILLRIRILFSFYQEKIHGDFMINKNKKGFNRKLTMASGWSQHKVVINVKIDFF